MYRGLGTLLDMSNCISPSTTGYHKRSLTWRQRRYIVSFTKCAGGILVEASTPGSWNVLFRRVVVVACCAVFLVLAAAKYPSLKARASEGFQPISPEELKMTSEPLAPGAPAIILYRDVVRDDSGRGTIHEDNYYRIKILTDEGRKYANIEIPFLKGIDQVVHIRARTTKPDGSVIDFDDKVFEQSLLKS